MPLYLPDNLIPNTADFETPQTSRTGGIGLAASAALGSAPTEYLLTKAVEALAPGKFLSPQEYKNSPYVRPGLDFPSGVGENVARIRAQNYDSQEFIDDQLNNMPLGALSSVSRGAGSLIGMALDPINILTAKTGGLAAEALIGTESTGILSALGDSAPLVRKAAKVGMGAAEGTFATAPMAAAQYGSEKDLGEDPQPIEAIATLGLGAGLGGLLRGVLGYKSPITIEADRQAKQTAVNQMADGKSVHVDEIIQNGYYQARNSEPEQSLEALEATRNNLDTELKATSQGITDEQKNLDTLLYKEKASKFLSSRDTTAADESVADTLTKVLAKPEAMRDATDLAFLNGLPKTQEIADLKTALQKPGFLQDANDRVTIKAFQEGKEADLIKARLASNEKAIQDIETKITETPQNHTRILKKLQDTADQLKTASADSRRRFEELENLNKEPVAIRESRARVNNLISKKIDLEKAVEDHKAIMAMTKESATPVEPNQLKAASEMMQDYRSDSTTNEVQDAAFTDELKGIPDDAELDMEREEAAIKHLEENDLLTDEDKDRLDKVRENERKLSIFEKAIRNAANCLKGFTDG